MKFSIYFFISMIPLIITVYIFYLHKINLLRKIINVYYIVTIAYMSLAPALIIGFIDELKITTKMISVLLMNLSITLLSMMIIIFLELFKTKILVQKIDKKSDSNLKHISFIISLFILLLLFMNLLLNNPVQSIANSNITLEKLLIQNETLINNTINRYKLLNGNYPESLNQLINKGEDSTFLSSIPYNPESNDFSWQLIRKNGRIIYVTANYNNEYKGKDIFEIMIFFKKYVVELLLLNMLIPFIFFYFVKNGYAKSSLIISIIFFFNFMLLFILSNEIYDQVLRRGALSLLNYFGG